MSTELSNFPIEWSPSPALIQSLRALGALAAFSIGGCDLPIGARVLLAPLALVYGFLLAGREARKPPLVIRDGGPDGLLVCLGPRASVIAKPSIQVRGIIATLTGCDAEGRSVCLFWGPDTLTPAIRRTLRLASGDRMVESDPTLATMSG